jgi:hypothetical protein
MAAHHPSVWAVTSAGAGFAETAIYAKVFDERKRRRPFGSGRSGVLYDATAYAANFGNIDDVPTAARLIRKTIG